MECDLTGEPDLANELRVARPTSEGLDEIIIERTDAQVATTRCRPAARLHQLALLRLEQNLPRRAVALARHAAGIRGACLGEDDRSTVASRDLVRRCEERAGTDP